MEQKKAKMSAGMKAVIAVSILLHTVEYVLMGSFILLLIGGITTGRRYEICTL